MNRDMVKGLALGLGMGLLAPVMFPAVGRAMRPTMNAALRAGVLAWERGREKLSEMGEYVEDMAAEARAQHLAEAPPPAPSAEGGTPEGSGA
ncbi:MAG: DUF5132 domain-containing protein [Magnetospirillum sp.]|nr:DUF5132 domain-containing protein [Magnetospirillum sp.]